MPKIIFTSRYLRDAPPSQLENYVRYIGTRDGVEKIDESKLQQPATLQQKKFINQLIRDIPQAKKMLEYTDFLSQSTIGNASEFISCALEQHLDLVAKRENYIDYIANRPRVERVGEHGLFSDAGKTVVLKQVQEEVMQHKGVVWTHVVSLRREDAVRLGYDSAKQWMALLRSKRAMLCKHMKIDSANLRWYAAFHNEGHHPHVHLLVYSAKDNDGYLTKQSIEAMRSELAHDIFRQDFAHIYDEQNEARSKLKSGAADVLHRMMDAMRSGTMINPSIEEKMMRLSKRLQNTGGKKVYGYLKRDLKNLIDEIVDELAKDNRVDALYKAWGKWQNEILLTYQNQLPPLPSLSKQLQFKSIKNMVIAEAMLLANQVFTFEDESIPTEEAYLEESNYSGDTGWWSQAYKQARKYLCGDDCVQQDFVKAFDLFRQEAEKGNGFAMYDLGRMYTDGLGCEKSSSAAQEWSAKALTAFHGAEQIIREKQRPYLWYRIGKMYLDGNGTEKDTQTAVVYWERSAKLGNVHAQYALAKMWIENGNGNIGQALEWMKEAADRGHAVAQYILGKCYQDGLVVEKDVTQSFRLFLSSAEQNNAYAAYQLGKLYLSGEHVPKDVESAIRYLELSAVQGNQYAQYALGKLYLQGKDVPYDEEKAVNYLNMSAAQENLYAKFLLDHLDVFHDPSVFLVATRLLHHLEKLFRENYRKASGDGLYHIDRKRRRKLAEKKQAQGHKRDDHEPSQPTY